jgi:hypothetical protein
VKLDLDAGTRQRRRHINQACPILLATDATVPSRVLTALVSPDSYSTLQRDSLELVVSEAWAAIAAISAAVSALVVLAAAVYARSQVDEARLNRHMALLLAFQDKYHSLPSREFRRRLLEGNFGSPSDFDPDKLNKEDFHNFWQLHDQLEVLGVLVERRLLDLDLVIACFHRSPPMVWEAIRPYIEKRRKFASPIEGRHFELLVQRYKESPLLDSEYWERRQL